MIIFIYADALLSQSVLADTNKVYHHCTKSSDVRRHTKLILLASSLMMDLDTEALISVMLFICALNEC